MNSPVIILVHTQMAVNIGMCARAMLNCGLTELRLVSPRDGWPNPDAVSPSTDAKHIIENAKLFSTLAEATADCNQVYAATARIRHLNTPAVTATEAAAEIHSHTSEGHEDYRAAILFGPEASGLDNDSMAHADRLMHYPMNPDYTSLNLAQAVLLFSWEWWKSRPEATVSYENNWLPAPRKELDYFINRLEEKLDVAGFFPNRDKKPNTMQKIKTLFNRSNLSTQEIRSLQGIVTSLTTNQKNNEN